MLDQWLLSVNPGNIEHVLKKFLLPQLNVLNEQDVQVCYQWTVETASRTTINPVQRLYLCALLGYLMHRVPQGSQLPSSGQTKHALDGLLWYLPNCHHLKISPYLSVLLEDVSYVLVTNSSDPDWLTLAAYFYPFCSNKQRLLDLEQKMPPKTYDTRTYHELLNLLLPNMERLSARNEYTLRSVLKKVFQACPDEKLLFELCKDKRMGKIFRKHEERQKFFTECYLDRLKSSENNTNIGEILKRILIIPEEFRSLKWAQIYDFVLKFVESHVSPTDKDTEAFIGIVMSLHLPKEQVYGLLMQLSTSTPHHYIVLQFLKEDKFESKWKSIYFEGKLEIGKSWLKTRMLHNEKKVVTAYQAFNELALSPLIQKTQKRFTSELLVFLREWLIYNVDHTSIIAELGKNSNVDDFLPNVQKSLFTLVKDILHKDLNLVNKQEILDEFFNSRYSTNDYLVIQYLKQKLPIILVGL